MVKLEPNLLWNLKPLDVHSFLNQTEVEFLGFKHSSSDSEQRRRLALLREAADLGYGAVAWNLQLGALPAAFSDEQAARLAALVSFPEFPGLLQLRRVTFAVSSEREAAACERSLPRLRAHFDLLAASPSAPAAFAAACQTLSVHVLTLPPRRDAVIWFRLKLLQRALSRNVFFELPYAPMVRAAERRVALANYMAFERNCGNVNAKFLPQVLLAAAAAHRLELRAPGDLRFLAAAVGFKKELEWAKFATGLLEHVRLKETYRGAVSVRRERKRKVESEEGEEEEKEVEEEEDDDDEEEEGGGGGEGEEDEEGEERRKKKKRRTAKK